MKPYISQLHSPLNFFVRLDRETIKRIKCLLSKICLEMADHFSDSSDSDSDLDLDSSDSELDLGNSEDESGEESEAEDLEDIEIFARKFRKKYSLHTIEEVDEEGETFSMGEEIRKTNWCQLAKYYYKLYNID